jgi:hypothetical protein
MNGRAEACADEKPNGAYGTRSGGGQPPLYLLEAKATIEVKIPNHRLALT